MEEDDADGELVMVMVMVMVMRNVMEDDWRLSFTKLNNPPATDHQKIQTTTGLPLSDKS